MAAKIGLQHMLRMTRTATPQTLEQSHNFLLKQLPFRLRHHISLVPGSAECERRFRAAQSILSEKPNATDTFANCLKEIEAGTERLSYEVEKFCSGGTPSRTHDRQLDGCFFSLLGFRTLIGHHEFIRAQVEQSAKENPTGNNNAQNNQAESAGKEGLELIRPSHVVQQVDIAELVRETTEDARAFCVEKRGSSPDINVIAQRPVKGVICIPAYLHYIVMELCKNALSAQASRWDLDAPPIEIKVVQSADRKEIGIKVSDAGAGMKRELNDEVFRWYYTTSPPLPQTYTYGGGFGAQFTGLGCGLSMSRVYARFLGGDLRVASIDNDGTSAYLWMDATGESANNGEFTH